MNKKEKLEELFREFPGVGPRQAKRLVHSLLYKNKNYLTELANLISGIKKDLKKCPKCNRFFHSSEVSNVCNICLDNHRNKKKILILEKNPDFENIEKLNIWDGLYFLIGKNIKLNEKNPEERIDLSGLISQIDKESIKEIVFALSLTPEGEHTKEYIYQKLLSRIRKNKILISELGRGLSLGSEIEYSDRITLKEAFEHQKKL